ncbi:MAG: M48 family metalloprotease [Paracoccaceae bacterium]
MPHIRLILAIVLGAALMAAGASPPPAAAQNRSRGAQEQKTGDQTHPKILARYGGEIRNQQVSDYVTRIGRKLARYSSQPRARWTFTVLDTPEVNAFAIPGGYVYVTRGLLALANSEAELAGVLGHEIGHVTAGHVASRRERSNEAGLGVLLGAVVGGLLGGKEGLRQGLELSTRVAAGYVARHSQEQEFAADKIGVRILARAGYDTFAQADFLDNMAEKARLDARLQGKAYNPNAVSFFASHPATADRVRRAIEAARRQGARVGAGAPRNERRYMLLIDGMIYGDSRQQGLVRGRRFSHPVLRFTYRVPAGFHIANSAAAVTAMGPSGSRLILDSRKYRGERLDRYISRNWAPAISRIHRAGRLTGLRRTGVNGLDAATASMPVRIGAQNMLAQLAAIRLDGRIYRLIGVSPVGDRATQRGIAKAIRSFRALSRAEAAGLKPYRIRVHEVRSGDTIAGLSRLMRVEAFPQDHFRTLNGYDDGNAMRAGDIVKLVVE